MKNEDIEKVIQKRVTNESLVQISFKTRTAIKGIFIESADFHQLSRKNLWRIVTERHLETFAKTHDENLAKIFNGSEFTRLELLS